MPTQTKAPQSGADTTLEAHVAFRRHELNIGDGFHPYAYVFGYLAGDCTEDEQAEFEERFGRLVRQSSADSGVKP